MLQDKPQALQTWHRTKSKSSCTSSAKIRYSTVRTNLPSILLPLVPNESAPAIRVQMLNLLLPFPAVTWSTGAQFNSITTFTVATPMGQSSRCGVTDCITSSRIGERCDRGSLRSRCWNVNCTMRSVTLHSTNTRELYRNIKACGTGSS